MMNIPALKGALREAGLLKKAPPVQVHGRRGRRNGVAQRAIAEGMTDYAALRHTKNGRERE